LLVTYLSINMGKTTDLQIVDNVLNRYSTNHASVKPQTSKHRHCKDSSRLKNIEKKL